MTNADKLRVAQLSGPGKTVVAELCFICTTTFLFSFARRIGGSASRGAKAVVSLQRHQRDDARRTQGSFENERRRKKRRQTQSRTIFTRFLVAFIPKSSVAYDLRSTCSGKSRARSHSSRSRTIRQDSGDYSGTHNQKGGEGEKNCTICNMSYYCSLCQDFALDPEEGRMRIAAHHMVRHLTAGMAMITCREPLYMNISNNLKQSFASMLRVSG